MTKLQSMSLALAAVTLAAVLPASAQGPQPGYHVAQTYKLGVNGVYDYMTFDPSSKLIYIAQGEQVAVFDTTKGAVIGTMKGMVHVHGVIFDKDGTTAYVSDGGAGIVQIFNKKTLAKLGTIPVGTNPDGMVIEPTTGHLFVFNGKSKNLMVVDLGSKKVIATLPIPGKPEFPTADGKGNVFVNVETTNQVMKFSAADNKILATWTVAGCEGPTGMAIDRSGGRIFPVCDNGKMPAIDTASGKVMALTPIGTGPDAAAYDVQRRMLFSSNGDAATLSVIKQVSPDVYLPVATVKTSKAARTLTLDPATGDVYVVAPDPSSSVPLASRPLVLYKVTK